jgi:hypothetical protein
MSRWSHAIRVKIPSYIAEDKNTHGIHTKFKIPMRNTIILEFHPIYMADRIAKRISTAIPACKQITINILINFRAKNEK